MRSVLLAAVIVAAGCTSPTPTPGAIAPIEYVALGDSYTSGPLIPTAVGLPGCARSDRNYAALTAAAIRADTFRDASCSGATVTHMLEPQRTNQGVNPPQLDSLSPATSVVTLGIGGNDVGFSEIVTTCVSAAPIGSPCLSRYVVAGRDELAVRSVEAGTKVAAVLTAIHVRSPRANVFLIGYPSIEPTTGLGCWPVLPFSQQDAPYVRQVVERLNDVLRATAAVGQATFVDLYTPSTGHDACQPPGTRWVEPITPAAPALPFHPNAAGMAAASTTVSRAILAARR